MADQRWYFTKEQILNSPSKRCGIDVEKELSYRQQAAKLIQDMGQKLHVPQLVINTAIVYMHRFYMFHAFTRFHRNSIGPAALFLAAKVEEQPRKLEHVIKVAHYFLSHQEHATFDTQSEAYTEKAQELVINENILLQTLGFDVAIDHPHTHVVKCFQMVRSKSPYNDRLNPNAAPDLSKHLAETSYIMATNSLHMTTMCLQYRPAVVACVCIYIVCKWSNYEIQRFSEGRDWFCHVDPNVNIEMLEQLTSEFLAVLDKYPNRLKKVMNSGVPGGSSGLNEDRSGRQTNAILRNSSLVTSTSSGNKTSSSKVAIPCAASKTVISHKEYSEKREKERRDKEKDRDHRDKHHLQAPVLPSTSQHHQPPPANIVQPPQITGLSHSRTHSQETNPNIRKPRSDHTRQVSHGNVSRTMIPQNSVKDSLPKREFPIRSEDKVVDKWTSDNNSVNKIVINDNKHKQSVDGRQHPNNYWSQYSKPIDSSNIERKLEVKKDDMLESYHRELIEVKSEPKILENVNVRSENVSRTKGEMKDAMKIEPVEENKSKLPNSTNSFMFKTFSYRDFLHPSEMPPDDIFDTEIDSRLNCVNIDFVPSPTHHAKLKSPPLPTASTLFDQMPPTSVTHLPPKEASNNVVRDKHSVEVPPLSNLDSKSTNQLVNANYPRNYGVEKLNLGNGIGNLSSLQVPLQSTQKLKRTKSRSPRAISGLKPQSSTGYAEPKVLLTTMSEEEVKRLTKESSVTVSHKDPKQSLIKQAVSSSSELNNSKVTSPLLLTASTTTVQNVNSNNNQRLKVTPIKGIVPVHEAVSSVGSNLKVRLSHTEIPDGRSLTASAIATNPLLPSAITQPVHKKHKHERNHHKQKHKEKKKHKHKDKDKVKDEYKEERKKLKKYRKEKHREKLKEKNLEKDVTTPLKITLVREKGIYTPDSGPVVSRSNTPVALMNIQSDHSSDIPSGLKLTIPRSRLQPKSAESVMESPAMRGLPSQEVGLTTKVKLKLHKDKSEKESRKRARSPVSNFPSKLQHSSSSHNTPQVGTNSGYQLPPDLANTTLHGNSVSHIAPGSLHVPGIPRHPLQHSLHHGYSHNPNFPMMPHGNYPMPMNYPMYRGQLPPHNSVPNFPQTVIHNDPYMPPYYPQYSMPLPNMNVPPPSYQNTLFSVPPPGYVQQQSASSIENTSIMSDPPLPPEPPPVKPPTPPPE